MKALKEAQEKLVAKQENLKGIWEAAGPEADLSLVKNNGFEELGDTKSRVKRINELDAEINDLFDDVKGLQAVEQSKKDTAEREKMFSAAVGSVVHPDGAGSDGAAMSKGGQIIIPKSLGAQYIASKAYTNRSGKEEAIIGLETNPDNAKTLFSTTAGWSPETTRTGRLILDAQRQPVVTDLLRTSNTNQNAVVYMEETTFTNAAAEAAEGAAAAEAALVYTEQSVSVRKIAVFIPVTEEMMEDEMRIASLIDGRLRFMLAQRLSLQILTGDGTTPNIEGILNKSGILTQAKGADEIEAAIYKAMTQIRVTGQEIPDAYVTHPNDWQQIRLRTTSDGIYIWGSPSEAGTPRIWGLPVVQEQAQTENTGLVGSFANPANVELVHRAGVVVKMSDSHDDYFTKGKMAIKATQRVAMPIGKAAAFCTVTGI
jgi:HK97 family phage major capsid protein